MQLLLQHIDDTLQVSVPHFEPVHVLLVEDDELMRERLRAIIHRADHRLAEASSVPEARTVAAERAFSIAIVDRNLADEDGEESRNGIKFPHQYMLAAARRSVRSSHIIHDEDSQRITVHAASVRQAGLDWRAPSARATYARVARSTSRDG